MTKAEQLNQVKNFMSRGRAIERKCKVENDRAAAEGMLVEGVYGDEYNAWLGEIKIFNERYLKDHPLYNDIKQTYFFNRKKESTFEDMMGYLTALSVDNEYWGESGMQAKFTNNQKSITITADLIAEIEKDIEKCEKLNTKIGSKELTQSLLAKYSALIPNFEKNISLGGKVTPIGQAADYRAEVRAIAEKLKMFLMQNRHNGSSLMEYDVFISHASADKEEYVDKLKAALDKLKVKIFYDKDSIQWGDNWKEKILEGVEKSEFAIIVISEKFFGREWTEKELSEFLNRQNRNGQKIILPILHNISMEDLRNKYPDIADIQALNTKNQTCEAISIEFAKLLIQRLKQS